MANYRLRIGFPSGYSLTAAPGSYSLSGQAANLTYSAIVGDVSALESWLYRSTLPGVFRKLRFDTNASVDNFRFVDQVGLQQTPSGQGLNVRRNPTEGIIGDGALELEQLSNGNLASYLWLPFDQTRTTWQFNETGFNRGPGEEFYVQVRVKTNCGGVAGVNGQGRKVFSVTRGTASYTANELVVQDTLYRGIMQMYQGLGPGYGQGTVAYQPFDTPRPGADLDLQPGSDYVAEPAYCSYQAGNYMSQAACATWFNNEWVQYRMHVIPSTNGVSNGTLELEFWKTGMAASKKVISLTNIPMFYDGDKPAGYNHFIAWIYETERTSGPANQKQWYDQIIISRNSIPFDYELTSRPTWWTNAATSEWIAMTGGAADTMSVVDPCPAGTCSYSGVQKQAGAVAGDWVGGVASQDSLLIVAQGGHEAYGGNEVYEFVFSEATPRWYRRTDPSTNAPYGVAYYPDGKPTARHGYNHDCFIPAGTTNGNRWYAPWIQNGWNSDGNSFADGSSWRRDTYTYDPQGTFPNFPGERGYEGSVAYDSVMHKVWAWESPINTAQWRLFSLDVTTKAWTNHGSKFSSGGFDTSDQTAFIDPVRRLMVVCSGSTLWIADLAFPGDPGRVYTVSGLSGNAPGWKREPVSGKWVHWAGGKTLRVITPPSNYRTGDGSTLNPLNASAVYSVGQTITPAGGATPTAPDVTGTYGRFNYIANPRGFAVVNSVSQPVYFFKIPAAGL